MIATPLVTNHAMVLYLERKHGRMVKRLCRQVRKAGDHAVIAELAEKHDVDLDALRREMLSPVVVEAFRAGAKSIKFGGVRFFFAGGKIVTVTPTGPPRARPQRPANPEG